MISFATVRIGSGSCGGCPVCSPRGTPHMRAAHEVLSDVRDVAGAWATGPGPNVWLVGAEAFAHPELPRLVADAMALGIERLRLTTDGTALAAGTNAAGSIDAGVRHLEVAVSSTHQVAGTGDGRSSFGDVSRGLNAYFSASRERQVPVAVVGRVPVCRHNFDTVPETVAALGSLGVCAVRVQVGASAPAVTRAWANAVLDSGLVNRAWVSIEDDGAGVQHAMGISGVRRAVADSFVPPGSEGAR